MFNRIHSMVTDLLQNGDAINQLNSIITPNSKLLLSSLSVPMSTASSEKHFDQPNLSSINLQQEVHELQQAVKLTLQNQQDFMNTILYSIIHRNNNHNMMNHDGTPTTGTSVSTPNMFRLSTLSTMSIDKSSLALETDSVNIDDISVEERRAMAWGLKNVINSNMNNTTNIPNSFSPIQGDNSLLVDTYTIVPASNHHPIEKSLSFLPNEILDNTDDSIHEFSPRKLRRIDNNIQSTTPTYPETALLIRVIAQLQEERVQLLAQLSEAQLTINERNDLLQELQLSLHQTMESVQEYSQMAEIFRDVVTKVQDLENTNTELAILARCTEIDKYYTTHDTTNNIDIYPINTEDMNNNTNLSTLSTLPMYQRIWNIRKKQYSNNTSTLTTTTITNQDENNMVIENTTNNIPSNIITTEISSTTNTDTMAISTITKNDDTDTLKKRIAYLEDELDTCTFTRDLIQQELKEVREKNRSNQLKLINDHTDEITFLKQIHAKTIARMVEERKKEMDSLSGVGKSTDEETKPNIE